MPAVIEDWDDRQPIPPGYHPESEVRMGLVIAGASTLGALWLTSVVIGAVGAETQEAIDCTFNECDQGDEWYPLFVPVAGPFIAAGTLDASGAGLGLLIFDGVVQAGGLAMLIAGLAAQKTVLRRDLGGLELELAPTAGPQGGSLGVIGRF